MEFKDFIESSQRRIRQRFKGLEDFISFTSDDAYHSKKEAKKDLWQAYKNAQQINRASGGKVEIYTAISPLRFDDAVKTLNFLTSKSQEEISVSVHKGVWTSGYYLQGTSKLLLYYPVDVNTLRIDGKLVPNRPFRQSDERDWDEAVIRLADVTWKTFYVSEGYEHFLHFKGNNISERKTNLENLLKEKGIELKITHEAPAHSPLSKTYKVKSQIEPIEQLCYQLNKELYNIYLKAFKSSDEKKEVTDIFNNNWKYSYVLDRKSTQTASQYLNHLNQEKQRLEKAIDDITKLL